MATDAIRARFNCRWINTLFSAVCVQQAEVQFWLPRPPVAFILLSAELVALLNIFGVFEVNGIFLQVIHTNCFLDVIVVLR